MGVEGFEEVGGCLFLEAAGQGQPGMLGAEGAESRVSADDILPCKWKEIKCSNRKLCFP